MLFRIKYQSSQLDAPLLPTMAHMFLILLRQSVIKMQPQLQTCVQEQTIMYYMYTEHNAAPEGIPPPHLPHTIIHVHLSHYTCISTVIYNIVNATL